MCAPVVSLAVGDWVQSQLIFARSSRPRSVNRASYFRLFQAASVKHIEYCIMELLYRALHIALHIELSYSHNSVINLEVHLPDQVSLLKNPPSPPTSRRCRASGLDSLKESHNEPQYSKAASLYINFRCIERCRIQNCHTRLHLTGLFLELFLMSFTRILWKFWNRKTSWFGYLPDSGVALESWGWIAASISRSQLVRRGWDCQLTSQLRNSLRQLVMAKSVQCTLTCLCITSLSVTSHKSQTPPGSMPLCRPRSDLCRPFWFPNAAARQRASDANVQIFIQISLSVMFIIFESWSNLTVSVSVTTVPAITREPLETCRVIWCRPHLICPQSLHVRKFLIEFACDKFWSRF